VLTIPTSVGLFLSIIGALRFEQIGEHLSDLIQPWQNEELKRRFAIRRLREVKYVFVWHAASP